MGTFFIPVVSIMIELPEVVVEAGIVTPFKRHLRRDMELNEGKLDYYSKAS